MRMYEDIIPLLIAVIIILLTVILLPPMGLNILLAISTGLSILILIISIYIRDILNFAVLPTLVLFTILFRLSLYGASVRLIWSFSQSEKPLTGHIITYTGQLFTGGHLFLILFLFGFIIILNCINVSKANRVSLIAPKFELEPMVGRCYMPIDPDLNAGLITPDEAKARRMRETIKADFYLAMDGAGRLIKFEALVSIILILAGTTGGIIFELFRHRMTSFDAFLYYSNLFVAIGLINTLSSFLISNASGMIISRDCSGEMEDALYRATTLRPKTMFHIAEVMFVLYEMVYFKFLLLPTFPFLFFFIIFSILGWILRHHYGDITKTRREVILSFIIYIILVVSYIVSTPKIR
ncbi:MAG TPA: FHIPEP family type III secretion protein [Candidatus Eremiobacteraeota bacterium]|nr:FHIPEP family type III secretion protein [Candidatus Eremiobacteraeota bacterium]